VAAKAESNRLRDVEFNVIPELYEAIQSGEIDAVAAL